MLAEFGRSLDLSGRFDGHLEHLDNALARLGRTLAVAVGTDLFCGQTAVGERQRLLFGPFERFDDFGVRPEVAFSAHQNDRHLLAEVLHFGRPLLVDIGERVGRYNAEAYYQYVCVRVGEGSQAVEVSLASRVPQFQFHLVGRKTLIILIWFVSRLYSYDLIRSPSMTRVVNPQGREGGEKINSRLLGILNRARSF